MIAIPTCLSEPHRAAITEVQYVLPHPRIRSVIVAVAELTFVA